MSFLKTWLLVSGIVAGLLGAIGAFIALLLWLIASVNSPLFWIPAVLLGLLVILAISAVAAADIESHW